VSSLYRDVSGKDGVFGEACAVKDHSDSARYRTEPYRHDGL